MKRRIEIFSAVGIAVSITFLVLLLAFASTESTQPTLAVAATPPAFSHFPISETRTINIQIDQEALKRLTAREQRDQMLDWLLYTVASDSGLDLEQINKSLFDQPPIRYGFIRPIASFQYGDSRSLYIGHGQIIVLLPADQTGEHVAQLGESADIQRANTGEIPTSVQVFEYRLDPINKLGKLTRRVPVDGQSLFTAAYGYYETEANSLADLQSFLSKVDDLTYVHKEGDRLILGGRKIPGQGYLGVNAEDIAAIWQANGKVQEKLDEFEARWQPRLQNRYVDPYSRLLQETPSPFDLGWLTPSAAEDRLTGQDDLLQQMEKERKALGVVGGLGFSLDPYYDFASLRQYFAERRPAFEELVSTSGLSITEADLQAIDYGLAQEDAVPMYQLADKLERSIREKVDRLYYGEMLRLVDQGVKVDEQTLKSIQEKLQSSEEVKKLDAWSALVDEINLALIKDYSYQSARYDGDLQGTRAGMTMFYTDLLAKLWAIDYLHSAPQNIEDFVPMTGLHLSTVYKEELRALPNTRLWFGPRNKGIQVEKGGDGLLFARTATRVYSASSNPSNPGAEVEPNAQSERFLGWWNDHYDEVARDEPQYQRLNEIMKWSLVVSWLGKSHQADALKYLAGVPVERTNWFPDWARKHPELKFTQWDAITFYPRGYLETQTESLPILESESYALFPADRLRLQSGEGATALEKLYGGVSLGDLHFFDDIAPPPAAFDDLLLRPGINYARELGSGLHTLDDITFDFSILHPGAVAVAANAAKTAKLRSIDGEVLNEPIQRVVAEGSTAESFSFDTRIGSSELGTLEIAPNDNGFTIGWWSREMDQGHQFAIDLSGAEDPAKVMVNHPEVNTLIYQPEKGQFLTNFNGSNRWMTLAEDTEPQAALPAGWQSRVADPEKGLSGFLLKWEDGAASELQNGYLIHSPESPTIWLYSTKNPQAGLQPLEFQVGELKVGALVDPQTKSIWFDMKGLPETFQEHPELLKNVLDSAPLPDKLSSGVRLAVPESAMDDFSPLARDLAEGDYPRIGQRIVADPSSAKSALEDYLHANLRQIDQLSMKGDPAQLLQKLDQLEKIYGARPEIMLRKGLLELEQGQVQKAIQTIDRDISLSTPERSDLFDEINHRLAANDLSSVNQENVYRWAEYLDWKNWEAGGGRALKGQVVPYAADGRLDIEFHLSDPLQGDSLAVGQLQKNVPVYVQDSKSLNNLDWSISVDKSLQEVVSGDLGDVFVLSREDIAHFNPARIYDPAERVFNLKSLPYSFPIPAVYDPCSLSQNNDCQRAGENDFVYVVVARH